MNFDVKLLSKIASKTDSSGFLQVKFACGSDFKLEPIFASAPVASRNDACFKNGPNFILNNHLASLI